MSNVVSSIENSFKSLVSEKVYRSITVKEICERAFISRHTFYANFIDKRAIITYLFKRDAIEPIERVLELISPSEAAQIAPIILGRFYSGIYEQADFYERLVKPMAGVDPTFELVVARCVNKEIGAIVRSYAENVDREVLARVAYYHASALAISLEKWICDGFLPAPEQLGEIQARIMVPSLTWLIGRKPDAGE